MSPLDHLRTWRFKNNLTQADAAAHFGVHVCTLMRWENDRSTIPKSVLMLTGYGDNGEERTMDWLRFRIRMSFQKAMVLENDVAAFYRYKPVSRDEAEKIQSLLSKFDALIDEGRAMFDDIKKKRDAERAEQRRDGSYV